MSNDMIIELTETSLQFIDLPDTYDRDIRDKKQEVLRRYGWTVHSCACPQVASDALFLPGFDIDEDGLMCHFPKNIDTYCTILSLLFGVCEKFGYKLINRRQERTVTL